MGKEWGGGGGWGLSDTRPEWEHVHISDHWQEGERCWEVQHKEEGEIVLQERETGEERNLTREEYEHQRDEGAWSHYEPDEVGQGRFPAWEQVAPGDHWVYRELDWPPSYRYHCRLVEPLERRWRIRFEQEGASTPRVLTWGKGSILAAIGGGLFQDFQRAEGPLEKRDMKIEEAPSFGFKDLDVTTLEGDARDLGQQVATQLRSQGTIQDWEEFSANGVISYSFVGPGGLGTVLEGIRKAAAESGVTPLATGGFVRDLLWHLQV